MSKNDLADTTLGTDFGAFGHDAALVREGIDPEAVAAERAATRAAELDMIGVRLATDADGKLNRAARLVLKAGNKSLAADYTAFRGLLADVAKLTEDRKIVTQLRDEYRSRSRVRVEKVKVRGPVQQGQSARLDR
jgi:hypothetical protein